MAAESHACWLYHTVYGKEGHRVYAKEIALPFVPRAGDGLWFAGEDLDMEYRITKTIYNFDDETFYVDTQDGDEDDKPDCDCEPADECCRRTLWDGPLRAAGFGVERDHVIRREYGIDWNRTFDWQFTGKQMDAAKEKTRATPPGPGGDGGSPGESDPGADGRPSPAEARRLPA